MSEDHEHSHPDYWKIYKWLLLLFVISYLGPELFPEQKSIVLLTAFGIAVVKALMVVSEFMHLNIEKRVIWYLFLTCLILLLVFFAGVAPDVLNKSGINWVADSAATATYVVKKKEPKETEPVDTEPKTAPDSNSTEPAIDKPDPKLVAQGKALFQSKICYTCHQTDPAVPAPAGLALKATKFIGDFWGKEREVHEGGPTGPVVKVKMDEAYFMESVEKPNAKVVKGAIPGMAPLPTTLEERKALSAYVQSLSK
jgi:caa(3)-type oxidase subunit IV